ncbi:helix-turn-helix domain-containing protein [Allopusillimonas ginsengisoli]|uniref:helix-turn-helix domain-containing protein n=1 Tax=Allopusillimonas ginsengisoli TaxID=453575 RepID=UPI00102091B2|nr:GAF domain-containing protein [Allopusillimonas ginsengisoli]TEA77259.1 GAF domain-containing protein [Allopusillimonas ginsengisoli]
MVDKQSSTRASRAMRAHLIEIPFDAEIIRLLYRDAGRQDWTALQDRLARLPDGDSKAQLLQRLSMGLTIKDRLAQHQQRERGLMAVIETAQDLTRITDADNVLQAIVQRARALLGCDVGYLSIYDAERSDFYVRATDGAFSERFRSIRIGLDTGVCGYVARHRSPYSSSDYAGDHRFNHSRYIDDAMRDENIASILGVPLLTDNEVSGVLFVGDRYVRSYTAWEKSILSTLGAQASVAIGNARLFEQAQDALARAEATNELLLRQTADTRAAAQAHEQLTALVARGGDLPDLCATLARRLNGRIVVCDEGGREIMLCSVEEGVRDTARDDRWVDDAVYAALAESRRTGRAASCEAPSSSCTVCAVVGGEGLLGGLILYTAEPLNDVTARIFERGAMVTGVVLLLKAQRDSSLMSDAPVILRGLVHGPHGRFERLAEQAGQYGVDVRRPMRLLLIRTDRDYCSYLCRELQNRLGASSSLFDCIGDALLVLANDTQMTLARETLLACLRRYRGTFSGVMTNAVNNPDSLLLSFDVAERCLALLEALDRHGEVFSENQLALYTPLLNRADATAIDDFLVATLGRFYAGPQARDARRVALAHTLLAYLDHGYNAAQTARTLSVHINTLRQRLETIDTLLGSRREAGRALEVHMALRLWQLRDHDQFAGFNARA